MQSAIIPVARERNSQTVIWPKGELHNRWDTRAELGGGRGVPDIMHGRVLVVMQGRSRMIVGPRIPTMPGRSASGWGGGWIDLRHEQNGSIIVGVDASQSEGLHHPAERCRRGE